MKFRLKVHDNYEAHIGTIHSITAKTTGEKRGAPVGIWVQGDGIELPCKYFVCRGPKKFKARAKIELRKRQ